MKNLLGKTNESISQIGLGAMRIPTYVIKGKEMIEEDH